MKSEIKQDVIVTLTLNEKEAIWLKGLMQNKLHMEETQEDAQMRQLFFDALLALNPVL